MTSALQISSKAGLRALGLSTALTAALLLGGCNGDSFSPSAKATKPIPDKLLAEIESRNMDKASPVLVRVFKQEAELEVWKQDRNGRFALLKTYPICRWSGDLGPKVREGDRQAPEGFYSITPAQMNPSSQYFLSFNTGYPNAYDKAWGRSGSQLMVHGDCSSRGCYAMTDEQISEIYALGRESFFGGQNAFQLQAYPFRMTAQNMARHRSNPNMPFWRMIKEGNDHFEVTKLEPKVDFCEKKYVFDAEKPENVSRPLSFNASARCPAYQVPSDIAEAVREKQQRDDAKIADLSRGTPQARSRAGIDGGMHPIFASKLPDGGLTVPQAEGADFTVASYLPSPGTIPAHTNPPRAPDTPADALASPAPVTAESPSNSATPAAAVRPSTGLFATMARSVGLSREEQPASSASTTAPVGTPKSAAPAPTSAKSSAPVRETRAADTKSSEPKSNDSRSEKPSGNAARVISIEKNQPAGSPFPDPAAPKTAAASPAQAGQPQALPGSQPAVQADGFNNRFGFRQ